MIPREGLKIIISLVLILSLVLFPLHIVRAVSGWLYVLKEFALDLIARLISRVMLSLMGNKVAGVILTAGRDGGAAFIGDWRDFLETAQYRGEDLARGIIGDAVLGGQICPHLGGGLLKAFNAGSVTGLNSFKYRLDNLQYYNIRNICSLPGNFNVTTFRNNFTAGGGWAAWSQLIQPQNNLYGVFADSLSELTNQRKFEEGTDNAEGNSGSGYTSKRTGCVGEGLNQQCTILGNIITPGDLFGQAGASTIDNEFGWLTTSDELQEVLFSVVNALTNKLTDFVGNAVTNAINPGTGEAAAPSGAAAMAQQDCVKSKEPGCNQKATTLKCDVAADGGTGGITDPLNPVPGGGGSASANCVEVTDAGIYDACMAEARTACGL